VINKKMKHERNLTKKEKISSDTDKVIVQKIVKEIIEEIKKPTPKKSEKSIPKTKKVEKSIPKTKKVEKSILKTKKVEKSIPKTKKVEKSKKSVPKTEKVEKLTKKIEKQVFKDFVEKAKKSGFNITLKNIIYDRFGTSTGGASFTGTVDIEQFLRGSRKVTSHKILINAIAKKEVPAKIKIIRTSDTFLNENSCKSELLKNTGISNKLDDLIEDTNILIEKKRYDLCIGLYKELVKSVKK